jgi:thiamine biosynthesis lipoprotein ApbE
MLNPEEINQLRAIRFGILNELNRLQASLFKSTEDLKILTSIWESWKEFSDGNTDATVIKFWNEWFFEIFSVKDKKSDL